MHEASLIRESFIRHPSGFGLRHVIRVGLESLERLLIQPCVLLPAHAAAFTQALLLVVEHQVGFRQHLLPGDPIAMPLGPK